MNGFWDMSWGEPRRWEPVVRRMIAFSIGVHIAVYVLGSAVSPLFPEMKYAPAVIVELTDLPMPELPKEAPAPPPKVSSHPVRTGPVTASPSVARLAPVAPRPAAKEARRWLEKLDAALPNVPDAPVVRKEGGSSGIPARQWSNEGPAKPGDFTPAVAPERTAALGKQMNELEGRVLRSGKPGVEFGKESEATMMFGGTGDAAGEPVPAWVREMIRKRVRGYLPELEHLYNDAIRRNPDLGGKMLVRFRIDATGKIVRAEPAQERLSDVAFVDAVLGTVRRWTFDPPGGRSVDVLYPFVFVAPS